MGRQRRNHPKILIVEGQDDLFAVVGLMRFHVEWGEGAIEIEPANGVEEILQQGFLSTKVKQREVQVVGVLLDADTNPEGRYQRIRQLSLGLFPDMPETLPSEGLIVDGEDKRLGVWVMPDNQSEGNLETFLRYLVPAEQAGLWRHAQGSVTVAREMGAACHESHVPKAELYTWMAWQEPPGQSPGMALTRRILDPQAEYAGPFVRWFRELYRL